MDKKYTGPFPFREGREAGELDVGRGCNPYKSSDRYRTRWDEGYTLGETNLTESMEREAEEMEQRHDPWVDAVTKITELGVFKEEQESAIIDMIYAIKKAVEGS